MIRKNPRVCRWGLTTAAVLLFLTGSAASQAINTQIEITPVNPTTDDTISIRVSGIWSNSCIPQNPRFFGVADNAIVIDTSHLSVNCLESLNPWSLTIPVRRLAVGSYTVIVTYFNPGQLKFEIARKTFSVMQSEQPSVQELIFPVVLNGSFGKPVSYQSTFQILNLTGRAIETKLEIYDPRGGSAEAFSSPSATSASTITAALDSDGELRRSTSPELPLLNGWGRLTWNSTGTVQADSEILWVNAPAVRCLQVCDRPSTEIVSSTRLQAVKLATEFRVPVTINRNRHTVYVFVNSSLSVARVKVMLRDEFGHFFGFSSLHDVSPQRRLTGFAWDFAQCDICGSPPDPVPQMFHGSAQITSDIPIAVAAVDVIFPEIKFVSVPMRTQ